VKELHPAGARLAFSGEAVITQSCAHFWSFGESNWTYIAVLLHGNARGRRIDLDQLIAEPVDRRIKQGEEIDQDGGCAAAYSQNMETAGEALVLSADNARSMRVPCDVNLSAPSKSSS